MFKSLNVFNGSQFSLTRIGLSARLGRGRGRPTSFKAIVAGDKMAG